MESHLKSAVEIHLAMACFKISETAQKLNDSVSKLQKAQTKLDETETKLDGTLLLLKETQSKLNAVEIDFRKKLETLQQHFQERALKEEMTMKKSESLNCSPLFIWKIENYSTLLREAKVDLSRKVDSAPFYTENYGYKLKARIYPNGIGKYYDSYLTLLIVLMRGEYDAILPWPFMRNIQFTLIDQQDDPDKRKNMTVTISVPGSHPESYARPQSPENIGHGCNLLHKKLRSRCYIVQDTLFVQVEVGPPKE